MPIINLTPHVIRLNDGREFAPSRTMARVTASHNDDGWLSGGPDGPSIRLFRVSYGETEGLPAPGEKMWYIVSALVAQATKGRNDLLVPATGHPDAVRKDGQVFSVPGFVRA